MHVKRNLNELKNFFKTYSSLIQHFSALGVYNYAINTLIIHTYFQIAYFSKYLRNISYSLLCQNIFLNLASIHDSY